MVFQKINKLAFICNLAFLTAMLMRVYPFMQGTKAESVILIAGLVISPVSNLLVSIFYWWSYIRKPVKADLVFWFNQVMLAIQVLLIISGILSLSNI
ncbi:hypothetical protein [Flavihumibacter solisilvae]|uniref:Uncharacterized protein n=1 Tax=Flavihumibacter solisilvae TaxID=1349421 RepID=A0A0C1KZJ9_9BACT|nr:hypothetical protein [Flavihumibacter solisilvae]KIC92716.1 hypothetical protein OI18_21195 [Flavihumibacter solisilvae]